MDKPEVYQNTIDLVRLVKTLLKRKRLIIIGTIAFTFAAGVVSFLLPRMYESEGFFRLSSGINVDLEELRNIQDKIRDDIQKERVDNMTMQRDLLFNEALEETGYAMKTISIPDYKRYLSQFTNSRQFARYIEKIKKTGKPPIQDLKFNPRASRDMADWIIPVYAYSKKDMSDLGQISRDIQNFVVGITVTALQPSPKQAHDLIQSLGYFIKDCILYGKLSDYIQDKLNKSQFDSKTYENYVIQDEFKLKQLTSKRNTILELMTKYPQTRDMQPRELFSLQGSGQRYLSPLAQVVGIESHMADIKENLSLNRRNRQLQDVKFDFFSEAKRLMSKEKFGEALLKQCLKLKDRFFTEKDAPLDVLREIKNELTKDFLNLGNLSEEMQFLSGPTLPSKPAKPNKTLIASIAFIVGFFIFVFLAFFIEWWESNRNKI